MTSRTRLLNRSQTGPVPLDTERSTVRSSSASSCRRMDSIGTSGRNTPVMVTFVKPRNSNSQSQPQSLDSELFSSPTSTSELFHKFQSVNDTIRQARNKAQRVLIYSEDGFSACQAFALAYNMQYYELNLDRALDNFERLKLKIELSDYLMGALEKWAAFCEEKKMGNAANSRRMEWKEARPATVDCGMKRVAWQ